MFKDLHPTLYYKTVYDTEFDKLMELGVRGIILDLDNTLVPHNDPEVPEKVRDLMERIEGLGLPIMVVSNNQKKRVEDFCTQLGIPCLPMAKKPMRSGFLQAARDMGLAPTQVAVIGDQIYTDVFGGNRSGMLTVLVDPVESKEDWFFKLKRRLEAPIMRSVRERTKK